MSPNASTTRWRDEADQALRPAEYGDVATLVALARRARGRVVELDWAFGVDALRELRDAVFQWGSHVTGRYRVFDARVLAAINTALGEHDTIYVLSERKNAPTVDCAVSCRTDGIGFRLTGHAPFDLVFGYGHGAVTAGPTTPWKLGDDVRSVLVDAVRQLGWDLPKLVEPRLGDVLNAMFGLPLGRGVQASPAADQAPLDVEVRFEGPLTVMPEGDPHCLFTHDLADDNGIYLWTFPVNGKYRPWYVGQTTAGFATRISQHIQGCLSGQYEVVDLQKLAAGELIVAWHPQSGSRSWLASLPKYLEAHADVAPKVVEMLRHSRFFLANLGDDKRTLNRVEGAIGRYLKTAEQNSERRFFGPGLKLPSRITNDRPLRLRISISRNVAIEGMPGELTE
jgi:hypothetical protein